MVGYLRWSEKWAIGPKARPERILGLPVAALTLPRGSRARRLRQAGRLLRRLGVRRALAQPGFTGWEVLAGYGVRAVDTLPLCQALAPGLILAHLERVPVRERTVLLRGRHAGPAVWRAANALCPEVNTLMLDFTQGSEELKRHLERTFGAAIFPGCRGPVPQVCAQYAPMPAPWEACPALKLWGRPELAGLDGALTIPDIPAGVEALPLLTLLWERGGLSLSELMRPGLDRIAENTYNRDTSTERRAGAGLFP